MVRSVKLMTMALRISCRLALNSSNVKKKIMNWENAGVRIGAKSDVGALVPNFAGNLRLGTA